MPNLSKTSNPIILENVNHVAVISIPRTGSKSLVNTIAEMTNTDIAYGILHKPEYFGKQYSICEVRNCVFSKKYTLHGHWHTLELFPNDIQDFVKKNYKIVTILRDHEMIKKSINVLLNNTLKLNLPLYDLEKKINNIIDDSYKVMDRWPIYKTFNFKELYNRI